MTEPARARHGVPGLALGAAMLVAERLRRLTGPVDPAEQARIEDLLTSGVEPSPADARSPVAIAVGLTQQSYDLARRTGARVGEATRSQARRLAGATRAALPANSPIDTARDVVTAAGLRGRDTLVSSRAAAAVALRDTVDESLTWVEKSIVPRMVDNLMPYLINSVVPRLVEGAIPEIRRKVIPVVIDDMTRDPRLQELITEQSRGVLASATDELRETSATADDRIESSFRRVFHRHHANGER
ncbi:hypothetical protein [Catellatospora sp. NPDC049133]|jgi:hypothetical protein|uniref:hypothetical protein n=1 Tax=Catellatospora sp. NPDC049133 TaxID=3155499 RepID=UPI0033D0351D